MDAPFVPVARVVKSHGLHGEVAVKPLVDLPLLSLEGLTVYVVPPNATVREATVTGVRPGPKGPLLSLEGVADTGSARSICGTTLLVRRDDLPEGFEDSEPDPVGLEVLDSRHGSIGIVSDVIVTGANDVWVVDGPLGQVLVPVIDDVVLSVDEDARTASVTLLPGLIDGD
jgi:16S rRNA processing protein RimM